MKSIRDIDVKNKRVLVRVDYNVPIDENGDIASDTRIISSLPTIKFLIEKEAKVIIMTHFGRPKAKEPQFRLDKIALRLADLLGKKVDKTNEVIGEKVEQKSKQMNTGDILMLENVRFEAGETKNDPELIKAFASIGDIFVNDAFSASHRSHASVAGIAEILPSCAGFSLEKELIELDQLLHHPQHPFILLQGGAKVSNKIGAIKRLMEKLDVICIGGGMAFTFLKAMGHNVGKSILEHEKIEVAREMIERARQSGKKLILPIDVVVTDSLDKVGYREVVASDKIPSHAIGADIGPSTVELFKKSIIYGKTVLANGPMGIFEKEGFGTGTMDLYRFLGDFRDSNIVAAGGDTSAAIEKFGLSSRFNYISLGGGATLEYLEGKELPGIKQLS